MEFNKSNVYTLVNADEIVVGTKGYYANDLVLLGIRVERGNEKGYGTITEIRSENWPDRFRTDKNEDAILFYPIEEPKEKALSL